MFPFPVILVGVSDKLVPPVRKELTDLAAAVEAEYRGADSAIEGLRGSTGKKLLIVHFESAVDAHWVRRLVETFGDWPILALVESAQESGNLLRANRAGAVQVVPVPLDSRDLDAALHCIALQISPAGQASKVLAFTGSAAGCGATTIATNAAYEIAVQFKRHTVLVELAHQMGVLATNLDVEPSITLADLVTDIEQLDAHLVQQTLIRVAENFDILVGSRGIAQSGPLPAAGVLRVVDYLRRLADVVILDVPCTYNDAQFEVLGAASQIVLIGEQSIASIRTLKLILDALSAGGGRHSFHVVLNRYDSKMPGLTAGDLEKTLDLPSIFTIPDDHFGVLAAANQGQVLRQMNPQSPMLAAIDTLVESLLGNNGVAQSRARGLFQRILYAFKK